MKTKNEIKQKIMDSRERLNSGDLDIKTYEEIASGIVALQWAVSNYNKGEKTMKCEYPAERHSDNNKDEKDRLRAMDSNIGLVADYKPNRVSFYILLLASGRTDQLMEVLYKDMEKYKVEKDD